MLGLKSNGIRLIGGDDSQSIENIEEIYKILETRGVKKASDVTATTFVFAINNFKVINRRVHKNAFVALETPWFLCSYNKENNFPDTTDNKEKNEVMKKVLKFETKEDLVDFITIMFYSSDEFLHLEFELSSLNDFLLNSDKNIIKVYDEDRFYNLDEKDEIYCFAFTQGGFNKSDILFSKLNKEYKIQGDKIHLVGNFSSKYNFIRSISLI